MRFCLAFLFCLVALISVAQAGPLSREEFERQKRVIEQLEQELAVEPAEAAKMRLISQAMARESNVDMRRRILELALAIRGAVLETFLTGTLTNDEDAGLRSEAAKALGRTGSEKCLPCLAKAASSDRTTSIQMGDIGSRSSARRAATFAIAELAERHPKLADKAAEELRALPRERDPKDNESLGDARLQALYQITRDEKLLAPFHEQLKSTDSKLRERGLVAFQLLGLKVAPPEVVKALQDADVIVRGTAAMVLGRIGDRQTVEPLLALAADKKEFRSVRVNAIWALGHMRAMPAAETLEKLLDDAEVATSAAIALYRITGKKVKQFPEGYNAD